MAGIRLSCVSDEGAVQEKRERNEKKEKEEEKEKRSCDEAGAGKETRRQNRRS